MQYKSSFCKESSELREICGLLSSLVRLMSCYVKEPSVNHAMTLVHMMKQIQDHPDLSANPTAEVAVKQAQIIWHNELQQAQARCALNCTHINKNKDNIH